MTPQSPRQPSDIIKAILANLEMCADLSERTARTFASAHDMAMKEAVLGLQKESGAWRQAIALIRVEAASLLTVTP